MSWFMLMIIMRYSVTASYDNNISHTDETLDHKLSKYLPSLNVSAITGRFLFSIGYYSEKPVFESKAGQDKISSAKMLKVAKMSKYCLIFNIVKIFRKII